MIEIYWKFLGQPMSQVTGAIVDIVPFSVSEIILWFSLFSLLFWLTVFLRRFSYFRRSPLLKIYFSITQKLPRWLPNLGLLLLIIQIFSQGATPLDFVPTVFRKTPIDSYLVKHSNTSESIIIPKFETKERFDSLRQFHQDAWLKYWTTETMREYQLLSVESLLPYLNEAAEQALVSLGYPKGRRVTSVKKQIGITRLLGLSYGGPAYHDVITGEVVFSSKVDYPTPKTFQIKGYLHEIIHAKGFTDELITEQLTWLALHQSKVPLLQAISHYMFLLKCPPTQQIIHPLPLVHEIVNQYLKRMKFRNQTTLLYWSREFLQAINVQNSGKKYGFSDDIDEILYGHPWFDFVLLYHE